ncbi:MAG: 5-(carboxyamino)imidazole ribonucleotide mutase, partial [Betaproteobacteria bacterium]|nr:5-(carboxyamino)imidazole ribonucleotide mutase [Betaproteobacteria bacterium]
AGAANAGLFAVALLALSDPATAARLESFRKEQAEKIKAMTLPELE